MEKQLLRSMKIKTLQDVKKKRSTKGRFRERHAGHGLLNGKSLVRKNEFLTEGATLLRTPVEYQNYKFFIQLDLPVGERQVSVPAFLLAGWKSIK